MLIQIVYASRPFGFDNATLGGILLDARRCNVRDRVTGALICRDDLYLQLLEGPEDAVDATYRRITRDDRHLEVRCLARREIAEDDRMFADWAMRDDPAQSWVWSRDDMANGVADAAPADEVFGIFAQLAQTEAAADQDPAP